MIKRFTYRLILLSLLSFGPLYSWSQLTVSGAKTPVELVEDVLLGAGVTASNITYTGDILARGEFDASNSNIGFNAGVLLTTGSINNAIGPNNVGNRSRNNGEPGDADINAIITPITSRDAAVLEFDFRPISDTIRFNYVFASEEYPEYAPPISSSFNDAFAFLLTGPNPAGGTYTNVNVALIPNTTTPVSINNVNPVTNTAYYVPNGNLSSGAQSSPNSPANVNNVQFDAFTTPLTAIAAVVPCATYHIKLVVADAFDFVWDSGVFLEANSFGSKVKNPTIDFVSTAPACTGDTVDFLNTGSSGPGILFDWDFGSGASPATSTLENPTDIVYSTPGLKLIKYSMNINCGDTTLVLYKGITIDETPVPSFSSNAPQCENQPVNFTYTGTTGSNWTYQWDFGSGATPSVSYAQNPTGIVYSTSGSKTVTLHVMNGNCMETISQNITINARPTASFVSNAPVGIGYGVNFTNTGTSGVTYAWNFGLGASPATSTAENPSGITYGSDGIKTVNLIASAAGCADSTTGYLTILTTPSPSFTSNAPQPSGFPVNFTYTGNTGSNFTYSWDFGSGAVPSSSNAQNPPSVYYSTPGTKVITLTVTNGSVVIVYTQTITIDNPPISAFTSSAPDCEGVGINFQNIGTTGATYAWDFGSGASPATSTAQNPSNVVYSSSGFKTVRLITNLAGDIDTSESTIYIIKQPQAVFTHNGPQCQGAPIDMTYGVSGGTGWSYTWDFGSSALPNISAAMSPKGILYQTAGTKNISLTVSNGICSETSSQTILINPTPTAGFVSTAPACTGDSISFSNVGSTGLTYTWDMGPGSNPSSSSVENPQDVMYSSAGIKSIRQIVSQGACVDTAYGTINIHQTPSPSFTNVTSVCQGSEVAFTYTGNNASGWTYNWDFGGGSYPHVSTAMTPPMVAYSDAGIKTISLTVSNQMCAESFTNTIRIDTTPIAAIVTSAPSCSGDSLQLGVNGLKSGITYSFDWKFADPVVFDNTTWKAVYPDAGIKTVQLKLGIASCFDSTSASMTIHQTPTTSFSSTAPVCQGEKVDFLNTGSTGNRWNYQWDFGSKAFPSISASENPSNVKFKAAGMHQVVLRTGDVYCYSSDTMTIEVAEIPQANAGIDTILCADDCAPIGMLDPGGFSYSWFPSTGLSDSKSSNPTVCPTAEFSQYVLTMTNDTSFCKASDTIRLTMLTSALADAGSDVEICYGDSIQIGSAIVEGHTYQWEPSEGILGANLPSPMVSPENTITYTLSVKYKHCEAITDEVLVTVRRAVAYAGEDVTIAKGEQVELNASGGVLYEWTGPSLSHKNIPNPVVNPTDNALYKVLVKDVFNCEDVDSVTVFVVDPEIFIPTAFTPNGSGKNDVFRVRGNPIQNFKMSVFNRNGELVYYSEDFYQGWNGNGQNGAPMDRGAYVYKVKGIDENGEEILLSGIVNLIR